ncbi:hypothetical protein [Nocardioides deserti]|nr:hypothetical protein [Nocardioides deserti]GGO72408.1 hypothetical protein GCM10012276_15700 [Nocardioides deserti]
MPNPSRPAPVTWADLVHIQATHGIRPTGTDPAKPARVLHAVYAAWEAAEGVAPGRGNLMPVHLLTGHVRQHLRAEGRVLDTGSLRALIVNALNDPASGLEIELRPYHRKAA